MRRLGDTSQQTPTVDSNKVIHVIQPANYSALGLGGKTGTNSCSTYMDAASKALGGGNQPQIPGILAKEVKYAECMRAHGVPSFQDPNGHGITNMPAGVDPNSPTFQSAKSTCQAQTGLRASSGGTIPGSVEFSPAANG